VLQELGLKISLHWMSLLEVGTSRCLPLYKELTQATPPSYHFATQTGPDSQN
jgi:hypothetical protein